MAQFERYVGIDYSGAKTPTASLKGLRVYMAKSGSTPVDVAPPPSPRRYWTRRGIAEWLVHLLREDVPTLVGIDHGFSFPLRYFDVHGLPRDWAAFLDDFRKHWPTDEDHMYVEFVRNGAHGNGRARTGDSRWRRVTEVRAGAKSVFHFGVPGSVGKSTHAGLPWLRYIRQQMPGRVHFWPFDGWIVPAGSSAVVEVYPALWSPALTRKDLNGDQRDAFSAAEWMQRADRDGSLVKFFDPPIEPPERAIAEFEGWILGVTEGRHRRTARSEMEPRMSEQEAEGFPPGVAEKLKTYVYRLIDPRNGETFYVGKGKGNRVFAHIRLERTLQGEELDNKAKRIREIHTVGLEVGHVIHRHGLDDKTAYEVEAALIDAYPGLTNLAGGAGSGDYGAMHAKEIITRYCSDPATFRHKALLISVNRSVTERSLYDAVRYAWKISRSKAREAEVILATQQGLIIGAFVAHQWLEATAANFPGREDVRGRLGFVGEDAPPAMKALYVGKRVPDDFRKPGASNPIKYTWR